MKEAGWRGRGGAWGPQAPPLAYNLQTGWMGRGGLAPALPPEARGEGPSGTVVRRAWEASAGRP